MKKLVSILIMLVILLVGNISLATNEILSNKLTQEELEMQSQTNAILNSIESQVLDKEGNTRFVYALFAVVGISMIFEYLVRNYKTEIRKRKEEKEDYKEVRKKLWIVYGIHVAFMVILALIVKYALALTDIYVFFLIIVTFYVVEFAPLFSFSFWRKKRGKKNDTSQ